MKSVLGYRKIIAALLLLATQFLFVNKVLAQDPHYSQFYSSPMTLNPALTGVFAGEVRMAMTYRNQWKTVATPFTTSTVACDFQLLNGKLKNQDVFGFGLMGMVDESNNHGLKSTYVSMSTAYNKSLDMEGRNKIGVGFQGTLVTKRVDYSRFVFSRQFTPLGFDPSLPTGEPISGFSINYMDFATGVLYSGMNLNEQQWYLGGSYYHFNRPNEAVNGVESRLQPRLSVHSGFNFPIGELNRVYLSGIYMNSSLAHELMFGTVLESSIRNDAYETSLYTGLYYRNADALIPYVGISNGKMQLGLSYDINISTLKTATMSRGGFEMSLQMNLSRNPEANKIPKCYNKF
jgi:type IX secretion system PorP/SprF family membrane protein